MASVNACRGDACVAPTTVNAMTASGPISPTSRPVSNGSDKLLARIS